MATQQQPGLMEESEAGDLIPNREPIESRMNRGVQVSSAATKTGDGLSHKTIESNIEGTAKRMAEVVHCVKEAQRGPSDSP